jgi:hypothetical protein
MIKTTQSPFFFLLLEVISATAELPGFIGDEGGMRF